MSKKMDGLDYKDGYEETESFLDEDLSPFDITLPVMASSNSMFVRLGIEFGPFAKGDLTRQARLPDNWRLVRSSKNSQLIVDDNGGKRAELIIDGSRKANLHIIPRFTVGIDKKIVDANVRARFCVWDQRKAGDDKVIFEVSYPVPNAARNRHDHNRAVKHFTDRQECKKWLDEHYPNWENPLEYWDEEIKDEQCD